MVLLSLHRLKSIEYLEDILGSFLRLSGGIEIDCGIGNRQWKWVPSGNNCHGIKIG